MVNGGNSSGIPFNPGPIQCYRAFLALEIRRRGG